MIMSGILTSGERGQIEKNKRDWERRQNIIKSEKIEYKMSHKVEWSKSSA